MAVKGICPRSDPPGRTPLATAGVVPAPRGAGVGSAAAGARISSAAEGPRASASALRQKARDDVLGPLEMLRHHPRRTAGVARSHRREQPPVLGV